MFNSTHTLLGISVARTGLDRWAPHAVWTSIIASNLPDIDIVTAFDSTATYIAYHRGITHTVAGVAFLSLVLAGVMHLISGKFSRHLVVALIAMSSHPLLDYLNTYGVRPLIPWNSNWFYGDALFVIDPYVDLMLLGGLLLGNHYARGKPAFVIASLVLVLVYLGACIQLRNTAHERLANTVASMDNVLRFAVSPKPLDPLQWTGFVETSAAISSLDIDLLTGVTRKAGNFPKAGSSPVIDAAQKTRTAAVFNEFARFPVIRVHAMPEGHRVEFIDVRFYRGSGTAFAAEVLLDDALRVTKEDMGFNVPVD